MAQPAIRCVEFVELVSDWIEGALTDPPPAAGAALLDAFRLEPSRR